jgi:hypothetical protein
MLHDSFAPLLSRRVTRLVAAVAVSASLATAGCGSSMKVTTDFDPAADFTDAHTYSWRDGTPLPNPLMGQRVVSAIDNQLRAKGFNRVESGGDLSITYHAAADRSVDVQSFQTGSPYACWGGCMTSTTVTPVTTGTLIVDIVEAKSNRMMWRGTGSDTVGDDPAENEKKINEAVARMFEKFPPKKK